MTVAQETGKSDSFQKKLAELRLRIDALPESQRNHLYELADVIAERHQYLQDRQGTRHDSV